MEGLILLAVGVLAMVLCYRCLPTTAVNPVVEAVVAPATQPTAEPVVEERPPLLFKDSVVEENKTFTYAQYLEMKRRYKRAEENLLLIRDEWSKDLASAADLHYTAKARLARAKKSSRKDLNKLRKLESEERCAHWAAETIRSKMYMTWILSDYEHNQK